MKEERSSQAARRARQQQEEDTQLRMARSHINEEITAFKETRVQGSQPSETVVNLGWMKKKGAAKCLFCEVEIKYYAFVCPEGGVVAWGLCMKGLSKCVIGGEDGGEGGGEEDGE
jgi:hypothetical protein